MMLDSILIVAYLMAIVVMVINYNTMKTKIELREKEEAKQKKLEEDLTKVIQKNPDALTAGLKEILINKEDYPVGHYEKVDVDESVIPPSPTVYLFTEQKKNQDKTIEPVKAIEPGKAVEPKKEELPCEVINKSVVGLYQFQQNTSNLIPRNFHPF